MGGAAPAVKQKRMGSRAPPGSWQAAHSDSGTIATVASTAVLGASAGVVPRTPYRSAAPPGAGPVATGDYKCVDEGRVYLGNARLFKAPAHIDSNRVYRQIPEYREILEKGLTDRDVHYHVLMKKVAARFAEAVKAMARTHKHDLVAEVGAIEKSRGEASDVPDRTDAAIAALN